ncbi:MAG: hypothetical protein ACLR9J_07195 [Eubacterium sp.]
MILQPLSPKKINKVVTQMQVSMSEFVKVFKGLGIDIPSYYVYFNKADY